jgi:hypothetical protein
MLDVNSPTKGLLVPRTVSASVTNPAAGMIIYDTIDMQLELYNGMQWVVMMTGGACSFWWADADGDTYGDPFNVICAPMAPACAPKQSTPAPAVSPGYATTAATRTLQAMARSAIPEARRPPGPIRPVRLAAPTASVTQTETALYDPFRSWHRGLTANFPPAAADSIE